MSRTAVPLEPVEAPRPWHGPDFDGGQAFSESLEAADVAELERALDVARASGRSREALTRDDFPLPGLAPRLERWLAELSRGRGFLNVKGLPVDRHDDEAMAWMYWGLGLHLGTAVSQNAAGDLLGHVRDTGADPEDPGVRLYKTRVSLGFHSDGADLVGLLCLRTGRSGGALRLVSTAALYNELLRRRPDLVPLLFEPFCWDRNEEQRPGEAPFFQLPICRMHEGRLGFFYIPWYIRKAQRHPEAPRMSAEQHALLDEIDEIAADPAFHLSMQLAPGEVNFLKNDTALHARTEYVDHDEPAKKRHLLRLWLTIRDGSADPLVAGGIPRKEGVRADADDF